MIKTSTIQFTINNLASKSKCELYDIKAVLEYNDEYNDVIDILDELNLDVSQHVVDNILRKASEIV